MWLPLFRPPPISNGSRGGPWSYATITVMIYASRVGHCFPDRWIQSSPVTRQFPRKRNRPPLLGWRSKNGFVCNVAASQVPTFDDAVANSRCPGLCDINARGHNQQCRVRAARGTDQHEDLHEYAGRSGRRCTTAASPQPERAAAAQNGIANTLL